MMVDQLRKSKVFKFQDGHFHLHFKNFVSNPCKAINKRELKESMDGQIKKVDYVSVIKSSYLLTEHLQMYMLSII